MNTLPASQPSRQRRLRVWILEHGVVITELAKACGVKKTNLCNILYAQKTIPPVTRDALIAVGIPEELLAPPTRPKSSLVDEVETLRRENAARRAQLGQSMAV